MESSNIFLLLLLDSISYMISRVVYNLFFHPLAKYKGPLLWSAFQFPFVRSMLAGDLPHDVNSFHEQYGNIVRIAPDELSFTDPAAWKDIYTKDFLRPWTHRDKPPGKDAENLISASEKDQHRFRKVLELSAVLIRGLGRIDAQK